MPELPLHILLLIISLVLIPALMILTITIRAVIRAASSSAIPPVPLFPGVVFPGVFDWVYTGVFIFMTVVGTISGLMFAGTPQMTATEIAASTGFQLCVYLPFIVRFILLPSYANSEHSLLRKMSYVGLGLLFIFSANFLLDAGGVIKWLMEMTDCPEYQDIVIMFRDGNLMVRSIIFFAAVIMAPICEEIVYRGFLYNILKQYGGRIIATILSAAFFSAIHGSLAQILPLIGFGIIQCILYEKTRCMTYPIILHAVYNSLSLLAIYILL